MPTPDLNPAVPCRLALGSLLPPFPLGTVPGVRSYRARFVRAGRVRQADGQPSPIEILPEALSRAVEKGMFNGKAVFIDHAGSLDYPSVRDLIGVTRNSTFNADSVEGEIELYNTPDGQAIASLLDEILAQGPSAPDIGLSIVFYPVWESTPLPSGRDGIGEVRSITAIRHIESIDLVFSPAADGRFLAALSSLSLPLPLERAGVGEQGLNPSNFSTSQENPMPEPQLPSTQSLDNSSPDNSPPQPSNLPTENVQPSDWLSAVAASAARVMISASGLPAASQARLSAQTFTSPTQVEQAIEAERAYVSTLQESAVVQLGGSPPRSPYISGMRDSMDRLTLALDALINGVRPPDGIQPLTGIRELYHLLSGDYDLNGIFHSDRVSFANVTSSTMAGLVANALNKRLMVEFQEYPQWWSPIVTIEDFASLQDVRWITLGGVGELPTVSEGAAYTELTWDDKTETSSFVKKGGYLGITLEAIDKDDVGRLRSAPRALAQAAWLTLGKAISNIFTSNSGVGPTMSDSTALFDAGHSNLGTTALSRASYIAARLAMRNQTELNSGERLGSLTAPKFLLVPPDLELTALEVLASEHDYAYALSNGTAAPANVLAEGDSFNQRLAYARSRVIVVDFWTDTNDWAAVADPRMYPTIGLGFRYGRAPEIFSVASPTAGLMFTNDTMPIKARFFFAVGPIDYKGLYKANVS